MIYPFVREISRKIDSHFHQHWDLGKIGVYTDAPLARLMKINLLIRQFLSEARCGWKHAP